MQMDNHLELAASSDSRPPFGQQLKHFRKVRGMSQLDLAHAATVSPRHVSFVESGRSQPSRAMVLRLADTLDLPLRSRNDLLQLAGFVPTYPERKLDEPALAPVRQIIDRLLHQHEPFPAFVIDRYWNVVKTNASAGRFFSGSMPDSPVNAAELFLGHGPFREMVENWAEVAWITLVRLRREAALAGTDTQLLKLLSRAESLLEDIEPPANLDTSAPTVTSRLRLQGEIISTVSTVASFSGALDVTLDELRVELIFPADETAEAFFRHNIVISSENESP